MCAVMPPNHPLYHPDEAKHFLTSSLTSSHAHSLGFISAQRKLSTVFMIHCSLVIDYAYKLGFV